MSHPSRRRVLQLTGAGVVISVVPGARCVLAQTSAPKVRYDVKSPDGQAMLQIYAAAVKEMNDTAKISEGMPRSWLFQWYTHAVRSDRNVAGELARLYPRASDPNRALAGDTWNTCEGHSDGARQAFFLPWHRMYLVFFEEIVRAVTGKPSFTLPYWDYTDPNDQALPSQFRMPNDPVWGSLHRTNRRAQVNNGANVAMSGGIPLDLESLRDTSYLDNGISAGFCANLDSGLHGALHVDVGNSRGMGNVPWAANDPIFWLHHCNIDRAWASWSKAGGENPSDAAFLEEQFVFADGNGQRVAVTVKELIDATPNSYAYDKYLERPPASPPFRPQMAASGDRPLAMSIISPPSAAGIKLGAGLKRVPLSTSSVPALAAKGSNRFSAIVAARLPTNRFILRFEGLEASAQPETGYDIYLSLTQDIKPSRSDPSYVGTINFFSAVSHPHDAGHAANPELRSTRNRSLDVTETLKALQGTDRAVTGPTVTLVPVGTAVANSAPSISRIALLS
jgi:tyrosinase